MRIWEIMEKHDAYKPYRSEYERENEYSHKDGTRSSKHEYKQMLMDWLIAFIMLFVLHYLMAFIIDISEKLTDICKGLAQKKSC